LAPTPITGAVSLTKKGGNMSDYHYEKKFSSCAVCGRFVEPLGSGKIMPVCDECFDSGRVDGWDDYSDHFAHA
jgi:hypothetical protein